MTGHNYLDFLQNELPEQLEDVPLAARFVLYFQHDGAPSHYTFLFADVVFPRFVYAHIPLETVTLDTPNNVGVFVTDVPGKRARTICLLSKSDK
jgi:hypothetical protein